MNPISACRSCGAGPLELVLGLGNTPLANALQPAEARPDASPEARFPLDLVVCHHCSLAQITATVPPEVMFRDYPYFSSYSETTLQHARRSAESLVRDRGLGPQSLVVEIASNDGYLLQYFQEAGVPILGIEPAENVAATARKRGIPTVVEFFGKELASKLKAEGRRADLILANNVMAHVPDVNGVVAGVAELLKPGGAFVMETPYVGDMLDKVEFDTIYHEHLFYYSLTALEALLRRHGLAAERVDRVAIHGGSLRVRAVPETELGPRPTVDRLLIEEANGVASPDHFRDFAGRVERLRRELLSLLRGLRAEGKRLAAYGAAAKGSTLLNAFGIGPDLIEFVVDRSPHKQGRRMPGVGLPIHSPGKLLEEMPDAVLLLTWNFADEILEQQTEYLRRGGRFLIPVPTPRVVGPS
ncbi:MAG: methyltransferase domain-containing protein [Isosphaeraceae bacterium]